MMSNDCLRTGAWIPTVGRAGERGVKLVQMCNLVAVGVVYLVLIGASMDILAPLHHVLPPQFSGSLAGRRVWTAIATAAAIPTVHIGG